LEGAALSTYAEYAARAANKIPAMLAYWDADQRCRFANAAYSLWFGVEPRAVIGRSIHDLLGDKLYALNKPHIVAALAGQPQTFERIVPGPDGVSRHSLANYIPEISNGEVIGFVAHVTEVTMLKDRQAALQHVIDSLEAEVERRRKTEVLLTADHHRLEESVALGVSRTAQFEAALRDVSALVDTLKESVVDHVAVLDRQGAVTATNTAWREFADLYGMDACGFMPRTGLGGNYLAECRAAARSNNNHAAQAAEGIAEVLARQREIYTLEYHCQIGGGERWFHMSAACLHTSGSGAVIVHADVTPGRKRLFRTGGAHAMLRRGH
jgi:PAS domain S-box-containing protein